MIEKKRHIHIASEGWADDPEDAHETVVVTFPDSTRWICDFYTFKCIESMRQGYAKSGGCLQGAYWCPSTPVIIVDNICCERWPRRNWGLASWNWARERDSRRLGSRKEWIPRAG